MKVFISWSGTKSHKVAMVFRDWLPSVIQSIKPYVSSEDIDKGARWSTDIAKELEDSTFGLLCVTKENLEAPWLSFEAGALSKTMDKSFVTPFLFNIKRAEVNGPILQFQSTIFEKEDIKKLLSTLNKACGESGISNERLNTTFDVWFPKLEEELNKIYDVEDESTEPASTDVIQSSEILEEILDLSRDNQKLLRNPDNRIDEKIDGLKERIDISLSRYERDLDYNSKRRSRKYQSMFIDELIHTILPECRNAYGLLILLSFLKDDFPWVYSMGKELAEILQSNASMEQKQEYVHSFNRMLEFTFEHPMMRELYENNKMNKMYLKEIPYFIEKMIGNLYRNE